MGRLFWLGWLGLGNGPTWQARIVQATKGGYGVRASVTPQAAPSYPLVPLSSPDSQRTTYVPTQVHAAGDYLRIGGPAREEPDGKYLVWASLV